MKESVHLKVTAASLLAAAFKTLFPKALLMGGEVTSQGFYYQFFIPKENLEIDLSQVEEVMFSWIQQDLEVRLLEMVKFSAEEYFRTCKESKLLQLIDAMDDPTVFLVDIGSMRVLAPLHKQKVNDLPSLRKVQAVRLRKKEWISSRIIRIHGVVAADKKDLKELLKVEMGLSHLHLGENLGFFKQGSTWLFLPKGKEILSFFQYQLEQEAKKFGFLAVQTLTFCEENPWKTFFSLHKELLPALKKETVYKIDEMITLSKSDGNDLLSGVLDLLVTTRHLFHVFCKKDDLLREVISSLHFVTKIFKILGFEPQIVLVGRAKGQILQEALGSVELKFYTESGVFEGTSAIEFRCPDVYGKLWPLACIREPVLDEGLAYFAGSACLSLERLLALLVEKTQGMIPFGRESSTINWEL